MPLRSAVFLFFILIGFTLTAHGYAAVTAEDNFCLAFNKVLADMPGQFPELKKNAVDDEIKDSALFPGSTRGEISFDGETVYFGMYEGTSGEDAKKVYDSLIIALGRCRPQDWKEEIQDPAAGGYMLFDPQYLETRGDKGKMIYLSLYQYKETGEYVVTLGFRSIKEE